MSEYKTFEELKEELGDKFEEYMYNSNIELLNKLEQKENIIEKARNYINRTSYMPEAYKDTPKEDKKIRKFKIEYSPDIEEHIFYIDGNKPIHHTLDGKTELLIVKINEIIDRLKGDSDE